jgi:hypothetical protein
MLVVAGAVLVVFLAFKPVVQGDGVGYFSYLHTILVDRDLDLSDEYAAARAAGVNLWPDLIETRTANGRLADFFPIGPALVASPAYALGVVVNQGPEPQYALPLRAAFTLASLLCGLLGAGLACRLALRLTGSGWASGLGGVAALVCTPLLYYLLYEPSYSHPFSFFTVSAFLLLWWAGRGDGGGGRSLGGWLALGLLGGVMALVRWQDGPLLAIALLDLPRARWRVLLLAPAALLAFTPQLWVDQTLFDGWLPARPAGQDLDPLHGHYLQVLFSSYHGLFVWSPVALAAAAGTALLRERAWQVAAVYALVVETALNGAAPDWWGGFAFGARRFSDLAPFMAVGVAALALRLGRRPAWFGLGALAAWNVVEMANLTYVMRGDHDPGYLGLVRGQLQALRYLPNLLVQGESARDLVLAPVLGRPFQVGAGLGLLLAEAVVVGLGLMAWPGVKRKEPHEGIGRATPGGS